jgi:tRNA nucleotidyltransferase/poly(A) polymerase
MSTFKNFSLLNVIPTIKDHGGDIYTVGGAVRDEFLGKESKDLDVLVTGIPMDKLEDILSKFGNVDAVGKSFGVLKFKPNGWNVDVDVAIPRMETMNGEGGHKGFDVIANHDIPLEEDLLRRDFTMNAMAKDVDGNLIDPFGGKEDLEKNLIKLVNPHAFNDDPLRMLRAVQFAARFNMEIESQTLRKIQNNAHRIKEIAGERILEELRKVVDKKGDALYAVTLLKDTRLMREVFEHKVYPDCIRDYDTDLLNKVNSFGDFMFLLLYPISTMFEPPFVYANRLKGDLETAKEIQALCVGFHKGQNHAQNRNAASIMHRFSPKSLNSGIIHNDVKLAIDELRSDKYPMGLHELTINGNDLMEIGLKGKEIGDALQHALNQIYADEVLNTKKDLLDLFKKQENE